VISGRTRASWAGMPRVRVPCGSGIGSSFASGGPTGLPPCKSGAPVPVGRVVLFQLDDKQPCNQTDGKFTIGR
jgi:hypothetical protein